MGWGGRGWRGGGTENSKGEVFILFFFCSLDFVSLPLKENKVKGEEISSGHQEDSEHDISFSHVVRGPIGSLL